MSGAATPASLDARATPGAPVEVADESLREVLLGSWRGRIAVGTLGFFIFIAIFGSLLAPDEPYASSLDVLAPPSWAHPLGTTEQGSDVLSQLLVGARVSIVVGFAAAAISALLGSIVGLTGGYLGGWPDRILDALENWFLVIPALPLMIVLARLLDPSLGGADRGHRPHLVGGHGPNRPRPGADPARARLRRAREGARCERHLHRAHAHPAQHAAADLRKHRADRRGRDPVRGHALVPRSR
jgi:hypothetical protein